ERQQVLDRDTKLLLCVCAHILFNEAWRESIKAGIYRSVRGEEISGAGRGERDLERLPSLFHEAASALQHRARRVSFIEMTHFRRDPQRTQQPPSAHPQQQLLLEAQLRPAAIEFAGDSPMNRVVGRVVAIQQVELDSADLHLPR